MRYGATINGETVEVDINRRASNVVEAQIGDRKYVLEARAVQPGLYWLNWENRSIEVVVTEKTRAGLYPLSFFRRSAIHAAFFACFSFHFAQRAL